MSELYVTSVYRYGDLEGHCYLVGVFSNAQDAVAAGEREEENRAGKYIAQVLAIHLNEDFSDYDTGERPRVRLVKGLPPQVPIIIRNLRARDLANDVRTLASEFNDQLRNPPREMEAFCVAFLSTLERNP